MSDEEKPGTPSAANLDAVAAEQKIAKATAPKKQVHHPDCGVVGVTGEHGDLGSNAIDSEYRKKQDAENK